ncbi:hypothetical protein WAI453_000463 [Rhynchosporium graminicola]
MSRGGSTTLYVTGFGPGTRARDLAYEFERLRCHPRLLPALYTSLFLIRSSLRAMTWPLSSYDMASRLFAFVEYESRRDADDAYHEMHNKRLARDDLLKIEWARTPPSANWRFDTGRERERAPAARRSSPRRGGRSPSPRRSGRGDYSPRKDERRDRDYERRDRGDRSRSPEDRDREVKEEREQEDVHENGTNVDDRKVTLESPPQTHDELDTAE